MEASKVSGTARTSPLLAPCLSTRKQTEKDREEKKKKKKGEDEDEEEEKKCDCPKKQRQSIRRRIGCGAINGRGNSQPPQPHLWV